MTSEVTEVNYSEVAEELCGYDVCTIKKGVPFISYNTLW